MRPIDADAAAAAVRDKYAEYFSMFRGSRERAILHDFKNSVLVAFDIIQTISSDEMQGKGEWVHLGGDEWCCSKCGHVISTEGSWEHPLEIGAKHCENCGTKMEVNNDA